MITFVKKAQWIGEIDSMGEPDSWNRSLISRAQEALFRSQLDIFPPEVKGIDIIYLVSTESKFVLDA